MYYVLIKIQGGGGDKETSIIYKRAKYYYYIYRGREPTAALLYSLILLWIN